MCNGRVAIDYTTCASLFSWLETGQWTRVSQRHKHAVSAVSHVMSWNWLASTWGQIQYLCVSSALSLRVSFPFSLSAPAVPLCRCAAVLARLIGQVDCTLP